jgi:hypothetical protein
MRIVPDMPASPSLRCAPAVVLWLSSLGEPLHEAAVDGREAMPAPVEKLSDTAFERLLLTGAEKALGANIFLDPPSGPFVISNGTDGEVDYFVFTQVPEWPWPRIGNFEPGEDKIIMLAPVEFESIQTYMGIGNWIARFRDPSHPDEVVGVEFGTDNIYDPDSTPSYIVDIPTASDILVL